jgi:Family of unknown function (DUF6105)
MRYILLFWALPMGFIWGWYFMSLNDVNLGSIYLSNEFHTLVFQIYGQILGIDPTTIPALLARACIFDTFLIFGILAFRRRESIRTWWNQRGQQQVKTQDDSLPNLSSAP